MPDFFRDKYGRVRIIRGSPDYDRAFEGLTPRDKDSLRKSYGGSYTVTADRKSRQERINEAADRAERCVRGGARLTPQARQHQLDKMNARRGLHRKATY